MKNLEIIVVGCFVIIQHTKKHGYIAQPTTPTLKHTTIGYVCGLNDDNVKQQLISVSSIK